MSQLDLAVAAGTTPRHLSFVETGPPADLIISLCCGDVARVSDRRGVLGAWAI
jgi:hypothetical protein